MAGLAWIAALLVGCQTSLLEDLDEAQANDLIVALTEAGLSAEKRGRMGRFSVHVGHSDFSDAWRIARARGLPWQSGERRGLLAAWAGDEPGGRGSRAQRADDIAGLLRADPNVLDARVVMGTRGAAVSILAAEPEHLDHRSIEARVRAVAALGQSDPIALDIHHQPRKTRARSVQIAPSRLGTWLASAAAGVLLLGCVLLWRRSSAGDDAQRT